MKNYKLIVVDCDNVRWSFEGRIEGIPIYVKEHEAFPKMMTLEEAQKESLAYENQEETILITE
jgi:hypothetical protein